MRDASPVACMDLTLSEGAHCPRLSRSSLAILCGGMCQFFVIAHASRSSSSLGARATCWR
eukprot:3285412-Pyramimonas_sp.AAC.1